jgi:transcriptional regulator with XRE-family HTH domain
LKAKILGQRIRRRREQLAFSQEALAELLNKDQRAISEYESGKRRVMAIDLPDLARALQVPIVFFFTEELTEYDLDQELLSVFHRLPTSEDQHLIINIVQQFCDALLRHQRKL